MFDEAKQDLPPKLLRLGDPKLYEVSKPFDLPNELPLANKILKYMEMAVESIGAVGIAAPQIGILKRIIMFEVPATHPRYKVDGDTIPMHALINPSYRPLSNEKNLEWEACLSVPGMIGQVPRFTHVKYEYTDPSGKHHVLRASNFHARVVQHEIDHLDGILYPLLVQNPKTFGFREEILNSPIFLKSRS